MKILRKADAMREGNEEKAPHLAGRPDDVTPQIARRAYELYEQRGRQEGRAVEDWGQAEREIRKDAAHK